MGTSAQSLRRRAGTVVLGLATAATLLVGFGGGQALAEPDSAAWGHGDWVGTWAAPPQLPSAGFVPNWSESGFTNNSVREVVRISAGGAGARITLSNAHGTKPLRVTGASVARAGVGAAVEPGSARELTFRHREGTVIPAGGEAVSDTAWLWTRPAELLAVTLYFADATGPVDYHMVSSETSYLADGDHRADASAAAFAKTSTSWYVLDGVEVVGGDARKTVVAFGDSITDGYGSTVDANDRYPDQLADRLTAAGRPRAVANAGIAGNRVLNDSPCFGEKAASRLQRDVFDQPGARTVIVLEGINDIGFSYFDNPCAKPNQLVTTQELIAAHREIIRQLHAHGLKAIGATLTPFKGAGYYTDAGNQTRKELNDWIRTSGEYDAVVDFSSALANPADPEAVRAEFDSGDHLHPNAAGYRAMAAAVDLDLL
ncbi:SGNH/GDSL hydrolase family protein [Solihabitans fulvus]|uniref:SGNH/GDSL hydrolase family protein n=1 Tax=Solihabitans fulvus TaxID=1892852 RepID=A0A5B2X6C7_9PSEU|nr:SGNH/GDSL hydrolase family protein [Solihabitans fulvus]KAA2258766.1 SGNH/GDSL hydrolase family protein [Solihabitans fulvus]